MVTLLILTLWWKCVCYKKNKNKTKQNKTKTNVWIPLLQAVCKVLLVIRLYYFEHKKLKEQTYYPWNTYKFAKACVSTERSTF